ncbi:Similar to Protein SDA1; acc. no. P53313 [Pyronema omphalodes CBS 100304]|uniref:Protein SDA1 n=1 Tax=Pyronema omphalodes (strain CBS 100304) TaxID=1076935 RepID=U4KXJ6_PYROM|nr:Similar to Protein SDA1; acc. no. P53313 [Pyronema omphalodes CBS 100304]
MSDAGKRKRAGLQKLQNLPMLQNLIRRDPPSYREEFIRQHGHYESQRAIFMEQPTAANTEAFSELIGFMAQVATSFPDLTKTFPDDLAQLLLKQHNSLNHDLREKLVQSLVLLKNKDVITSSELLKTLFPVLTATTSKVLRHQIYKSIVSEMRNSNNKTKNHKLNKTVQAVLFELVDQGKDDFASTNGLWAVKLTRELWKRGVWDDARAVEIMKEASLSVNPKVISGGVRFFLGVDQEKEDLADESESEGPDLNKIKHQLQINKNKKSTKHKKIEKAQSILKRKRTNKDKPHPLNFSALHLLRDPQGFADQLFSKHLGRNSKLNLDQKIPVLQLQSRLIGLHKLSCLALYSYLLKFLTPKQKDVTQFLIVAAQATHDLVPPDCLEPIVRKIADEFVSDGVSSEVATAGLNAIREICARSPLAIDATLLQDLTEYKGSKDKGVTMAARSLITLYREVAPEMLKRKDRGKTASMGMKDHTELRFGQEAEGHIEGIELLEAWKEAQREMKRAERGEGEQSDADDDEDEEEDDEAAWAQWEVEEDSDEEEEGWIQVESDGEDIVLSDSEDEDGVRKKAKTDDDEEKIKRLQAAKDSKLATTKILTPADFAKLQELREEAGLKKLMGQNLTNEEVVQQNIIQGNLKRGKSDREARIEAVMEGREGREKYSSSKGKKLKEKAHSTTNKEKNRKKNFLMTLRKHKSGQKMKLVETRRLLKESKDKQKGKKR